MAKAINNSNSNGDLNFTAKLWQTADKMRNNMDAAEYKHVVLGLIFLKYISDAFIELYNELSNDEEADSEDLDEYKAKNIFYVPQKARWDYLQSNAKQPEIGTLIDDAMDEIEKNNPSLKGVLPKNYARSALDKQRLGELIDLIGTIGLGEKENRSKDVLGRVYEYFLGQFADAEGKKGGQFYTPRCIVQLLASMIEPFKGRVYDPCCGSGGMFVQSEKFVQEHGGRIGDISIYGQESNSTTWRLCKMNLAIRGIEADIQWNNEGSFLNDAHKTLKSDFILANPPFNDSDWRGEQLRDDARWKYGTPPSNNANFAWIQHFIYHLSPTGVAGFVLSNGSMSSNTSNEGEIRKNIIEADLIDCMVALPSQLFYNTMIPACLWFIARDKKNHKFRDRRGDVLFVDARNLGAMIDRRHRELTAEDIKKISDTYHAFRGEGGNYEDITGFCKIADLEEIKKNGYILTPGRYVGTEEIEEDDEVFEMKMKRLTLELSRQMEEEKRLDEEIRKQLCKIGLNLE
jgi:type I restriction enzyme M protein